MALILEDALVNCDDDRFRRMGTALRRAAEHVGGPVEGGGQRHPAESFIRRARYLRSFGGS